MKRTYIEDIGLWALINDVGEMVEIGTYEQICKLDHQEEDDYPNDADDDAMLQAMYEYHHGYNFDDDRH